MPHVLCTALSTETGPHFDILRQAGFEVTVADRTRNLYRADELFQVAQTADAVIAGSEPWPRELLAQLPQLRVLSRTGVGFDAIDLAACDELGIVVATTPGVNHHAVAEHALSMMLGLGRGFPRRDSTVRAGVWERPSTPRLMGRTLGVLGLGRIGQAFVEKASGLGMTILGYDPYPNADFIARTGIRLTGLEDVLSQSDYLSLHLPVTPQTFRVINADTIARMKPGVIIINTARGALIDEPALIEALQNGKVRGAGLDVFAVEPLSADNPLLKMPHVMLSGHIAGLDDESQFDTLTMSADTILQLRDGNWPRDRIQNLKSATTWTW